MKKILCFLGIHNFKKANLCMRTCKWCGVHQTYYVDEYNGDKSDHGKIHKNLNEVTKN